MIKKEDLKEDKIKKEIDDTILFHDNLKKKHPIGIKNLQLYIKQHKEILFYGTFFMKVFKY